MKEENMFAKKIKIDMKKFRPSGGNEVKKSEAASANKAISTEKKLSGFKISPTESVKHRYGPEDEPETLPMGNAIDAHAGVPLAFCPNCNADRQMKWKLSEERGKSANEWFACSICGCDKLEIKMLCHDNALEMNLKRKAETHSKQREAH
jgi:hypothetical protein